MIIAFCRYIWCFDFRPRSYYTSPKINLTTCVIAIFDFFVKMKFQNIAVICFQCNSLLISRIVPLSTINIDEKIEYKLRPELQYAFCNMLVFPVKVNLYLVHCYINTGSLLCNRTVVTPSKINFIKMSCPLFEVMTVSEVTFYSLQVLVPVA